MVTSIFVKIGSDSWQYQAITQAYGDRLNC